MRYDDGTTWWCKAVVVVAVVVLVLVVCTGTGGGAAGGSREVVLVGGNVIKWQQLPSFDHGSREGGCLPTSLEVKYLSRSVLYLGVLVCWGAGVPMPIGTS